MTIRHQIRAIFFDFGGVITESPFTAFAEFEKKSGIPPNFIRKVNSTNPDSNAWARFERNDIDIKKFNELFLQESELLGHAIPGEKIISLLNVKLRPEMLNLIKTCRRNYITACLTNNVKILPSLEGRQEKAFYSIYKEFDYVVESSEIGLRKPEKAFYQYACNLINVLPSEVVFLDDLGINLKPAKAMGMQTIKVIEPTKAIKELEQLLEQQL